MLDIYDLGMKIGRHALSALAGAVRGERPSKFMRFARGQKDALKEAEKAASRLDRELTTVWIHAASLGEFGIARPIIKMLKEQCRCNIVLTFFSPTGYEALNHKGYDGADCVLYLPFDSSDNVNRFLDLVKPKCAVFMVSEYWHNYLHELHRRGIPAYLVSAVIRCDSPFFKWYGKLYRESIRYFKKIFVLNEESKKLLNGLGIDNVAINGDPLFDNVKVISTTPWSDPIIEHFVAGSTVFLGGSLHDDDDLTLVSTVANRHTDTRFILVPHEIQPSIMRHIEESIDGNVKFYSKCDAETDFTDCRVLVIDFVGALAYIYRYADMAYVGGGFTKLLHSIIEPAVYGLPVAFGPNVNRKVVTRQMMDLGIGRSVSTANELDEWFVSLKENPAAIKKLSEMAARYVDRNVGATQRVVDKIIEDICAKK